MSYEKRTINDMKTKLLLLFLMLFHTLLFAQRAGYWQQAVDYKMNIDVDEKKYQYQGKMALTYTPNSDQTLVKVYFHLYINAFQLRSMMDSRLAHIADPDPQTTSNLGNTENPKTQCRLATSTPEQ